MQHPERAPEPRKPRRLLRRWAFIFLLAVVATGSAWAFLRAKPKITFVRFEEGGWEGRSSSERMAVFVLDDDGGGFHLLPEIAMIRRNSGDEGFVHANWNRLNPASGVPTPRHDLADDRQEFAVPLHDVGGKPLTEPFQVGIRCIQSPSALCKYFPFSLLPHSIRGPEERLVWSDRVTP